MEEEIKDYFKDASIFEKRKDPPPFSPTANNYYITILLKITYNYKKNAVNNKIFTSILLEKFFSDIEVNILLFTVFLASFIITVFSKKL